MKKIVAFLTLCCCNYSFAWGASSVCSDASSCRLGGLLLQGAAGIYLDYKKKKLQDAIYVQQKNEHDIADTQEKKFQYLKNSAENITSKNKQGNQVSFDQVVNDYLTISNTQIESDDFKKSLVNDCFTSEVSKEKNGICTFNKYLNTYKEIDAKEKEARQLAAQKQAEQEAIKKRAEYKKQLAKGIPKTEYNLRRYCQASANIVVDAYVNAARQAQVGASSPYFNSANEELLNITSAQEKKLIMIASDDAERAVWLSSDYMSQITFTNQYATKCFANPKTMIINYYEIFKN